MTDTPPPVSAALLESLRASFLAAFASPAMGYDAARRATDRAVADVLRDIAPKQDSSEVAIRRAAMPLCKTRHPELQQTVTGFFVGGEFVAACASCQAEVRDQSPSPDSDALAEIRDLLPAECWVSRSDAVFCTDFVGGTFENGAEWTAEMCCLPCRIRGVLTRVTPPEGTPS